MSKKILCLFDVDGTLTKSRNNIEPHVEHFIYEELTKKCTIGLVGGSDLSKICEQMNGPSCLNKVKHIFSENGLIYHKDGKEVGRVNIQSHMGEDKLQEFINYSLFYLSKVQLPLKRGTFIEFRTGLINVCPVGRSCSQAERDAFEIYDKEHSIRQNMIDDLRQKFQGNGLTYTIGGQISFDVFPVGWDKTYCLSLLENEGYEEIHFFGDKTMKGGNDYEIFNDSRTIGHTVNGPEDTLKQIKELFDMN